MKIHKFFVINNHTGEFSTINVNHRVIGIYILAVIMFVFKQWAKKFAMMKDQHQSMKKEASGTINLAYESEGDLTRIARTMKDLCIKSSVPGKDRKPTIPAVDGDRKKLKARRLSVAKTKDTDDSKKHVCESNADCKCRNCRALMNLTECSLCCESLQSSQIKACPVCANVICTKCASRLQSCAFCRSKIPAERNRALERLVDRLELPCKNSRQGCKLLLDGESRFIHESICNFSPIICPVGRRVCSWHGTVANVQSHLHAIHNLQPLRDHGISIEIHSFRSIARANDGRVYNVCLACYDQLFVIRVMLYPNRLRLCFTRLGHEEIQPLNTRPIRYGVLVTVRAQAGRRLRGLVPFGKYDRESREVSVTCDNLYFAKSEEAQVADGSDCECKEDSVKIDLMIKQMDEC